MPVPNGKLLPLVRNVLLPAVLFYAQTGLATCTQYETYTIAVHGGYVGDLETTWTTPETLALTERIVREARTHLKAGASALDVVVEAISTFEDSGLVDAGKGSFRNTAGFVETDASVMDGRSGNSGAVAAMQQIRNPIQAARLVMDATPHVLFVGPAGEKTLVELGAEVVSDPDQYFRPVVEPDHDDEGHGTVGAAVMDRCGRLAAGTSTGGTLNKMPGRVGDSPIIGASTFATENFALSATGKGELFIKRAATRDIVARVELGGMTFKDAADYVVKQLIGKKDNVRGAIIGISKDGEIVTSSTGYGLLHGYASEDTDPIVGLRSD